MWGSETTNKNKTTFISEETGLVCALADERVGDNLEKALQYITTLAVRHPVGYRQGTSELNESRMDSFNKKT
jgi:hypothetical protein